MLFQENYMKYIAAFVGIMMIVALGAYTHSTLKASRYMYAGPTTVSVTGTGEVMAKPDLATVSFSLEAKEADKAAAQAKVKGQMDAIMSYLKEVGVEEKDIKTDYYNESPWTEYTPCVGFYCPPQEPKVKGTLINQSVTVKVRNQEKVGEILSKVGEKGAMNVSGPNYTVDDIEKYKAEAREKAIADAEEKGKVLAKSLNARIVRLAGYWEDNSGGYPMPYGMGGAADMMAKSAMVESAPATVPSGEDTVTVQVSLSYEIKTH